MSADSNSIMQINRHRSCSPYEWFGPDPEPNPPGEGCACAGCEVRILIEQRLLERAEKNADRSSHEEG
jgi:hypothetical protein